MSVIAWFKRRQKPTPMAVADFTCVAKDQRMPLDYDREERLAKLIKSNDDPVQNLEEIAKLLGQTPDIPQR